MQTETTNSESAKSFNEAKRMYVEQYGSALVLNTYLKIALLCLSLVAVALAFLNLKTYSTFRNFKPPAAGSPYRIRNPRRRNGQGGFGTGDLALQGLTSCRKSLRRFCCVQQRRRQQA